MAGLYTCYNLCHNPLPGSEDELVKGLPGALTKESNTLTPSLTIFRAQTPTPALFLAIEPRFTKKLC